MVDATVGTASVTLDVHAPARPKLDVGFNPRTAVVFFGVLACVLFFVAYSIYSDVECQRRPGRHRGRRQGMRHAQLEAVADGSYQPLSRPLFIYASRNRCLRPEAKAFAEFYVSPENAPRVERVGYVALSPATLLSMMRRLDQNVTGSIFGGQGSVLGVTAGTFQDEDQLKNALVR